MSRHKLKPSVTLQYIAEITLIEVIFNPTTCHRLFFQHLKFHTEQDVSSSSLKLKSLHFVKEARGIWNNWNKSPRTRNLWFIQNLESVKARNKMYSVPKLFILMCDKRIWICYVHTIQALCKGQVWPDKRITNSQEQGEGCLFYTTMSFVKICSFFGKH